VSCLYTFVIIHACDDARKVYCIGLLKLCRSLMAWAFKEEIMSWFTAPYIIQARNIGLLRIQNGNSVIQDDDWRTSNHQGPYLRWDDEVVIHGTCACQASSWQIVKNKYHWPVEDLFYFAKNLHTQGLLVSSCINSEQQGLAFEWGKVVIHAPVSLCFCCAWEYIIRK
jgi:hypothetical protein